MTERGPGPRLICLRTLCFIRDGDRILLLRRSKPPNQGLYNAPGGKIESYEDPYDACLREVAEETGLRLPHARLRALLTVITRVTGTQWFLFVFTAERPPGAAVTLASDEGDLRWIPMGEVASLAVVSDIPLMLPYLFGPDARMLLGKIYCENDDADSMTSYEFRHA
jgi:8-oxo-dGTP diphosphatase